MGALKQFMDSLSSLVTGRVTGFDGEYVEFTEGSIRKDQFTELPKIGDTIELDWKAGNVRILANPD
ncbi:MAG: hypothetical protein WAW13_03405 [Minisyncoccia bacterium]